MVVRAIGARSGRGFWLFDLEKANVLSPLKIFIFVSFAMPDVSLKQLAQSAHKEVAQLVFRGLIGGSLKETAQKIYTLGGLAIIDPTLFTTYNVQSVPTFVIVREKGYDAFKGNVYFRYALEAMGGK